MPVVGSQRSGEEWIQGFLNGLDHGVHVPTNYWSYKQGTKGSSLHATCVLRAAESVSVAGDSMNEWHLPCPVLKDPAQFLRLMRVAASRESSHLILEIFLFACCLLCFSNIIIFSTEPASSWCAESRQLQFCHFCLQRCFRLTLL